MTASGRIPCVNPRCRRTGDAAKFEGHDRIICNGCFKALPDSVRRRYKALRRRERHVAKLFAWERRKAPAAPTDGVPVYSQRMWRVERMLDAQASANYAAIWNFFHPIEKPAGLDAFLEEVGL